MDEILRMLKAAPPAPGARRVMVPGEIELANEARALDRGHRAGGGDCRAAGGIRRTDSACHSRLLSEVSGTIMSFDTQSDASISCRSRPTCISVRESRRPLPTHVHALGATQGVHRHRPRRAPVRDRRWGDGCARAGEASRSTIYDRGHGGFRIDAHLRSGRRAEEQRRRTSSSALAAGARSIRRRRWRRSPRTPVLLWTTSGCTR